MHHNILVHIRKWPRVFRISNGLLKFLHQRGLQLLYTGDAWEVTQLKLAYKYTQPIFKIADFLLFRLICTVGMHMLYGGFESFTSSLEDCILEQNPKPIT